MLLFLLAPPLLPLPLLLLLLSLILRILLTSPWLHLPALLVAPAPGVEAAPQPAIAAAKELLFIGRFLLRLTLESAVVTFKAVAVAVAVAATAAVAV
jgi:hypothetical protein